MLPPKTAFSRNAACRSGLTADGAEDVTLLGPAEHAFEGVLTHGGADDVGGTSLDERIAKAAGGGEGHRFVSLDEMQAFLADLHLRGVLVNSVYQTPGAASSPASPPIS